MSYYVGLDVSVKSVSICVVEADGAVMARGEVSSDPAFWDKGLSMISGFIDELEAMEG